MPTDIILTPEQEQLKIMMILKYGDLTEAFWSKDTFTPKENRILEHNLMNTTKHTNVNIDDYWQT